MTADIRVPDLGVESHLGCFERIFGVQADVDDIGASFVRGSIRAFEGAFEVCEIIEAACWLHSDLGVRIRLEVCKLFGDTTVTLASHVEDLYYGLSSK